MSKIDRAIRGSLLQPKGFGTALTLMKLHDEERSVSGFDIEADRITAEPFLLGFSTDGGDGHICFDETPIKSAMKMIDFHTKFSFRQSINFYYNLQYDFEGMLKFFNKEVAILLYGATSAFLDEHCNALTIEKAKEESITYSYKVSYIPKKAFHIKIRGDKKYSYYDLLQYYQMGLDKAAKKYLDGEGKDDFKAKYTSKALFECRSTIEFEILRFTKYFRDNAILTSEQKVKEIKEMTEFFRSFNSPQHYRETLIKYCIKDASICRKLGHIIVDGINSFVNTKNFNSSATISEYYFRSNNLEIPKLAPHILQDAMRNYYGGRFENMKKGYIRNVSIYDIKSAYPYAMADMMILSKNPIVKNVYSFHEEAIYGTYNINVHIPPDTYISPLPVRESLLYFPNGHFKNYHVDKITLKTLLDNGYDVTLNEAMEIYDDNASPKLRELILKLFAIKEDKKNQPEVVRLAAKIILNSLYGKFIQLVDDTGLEIINDLEDLETISPAELFHIATKYYKRVHTNNFKTGKLFAPYYAAHITAHTRNYLFDTSKKVGYDKIIAYHTDSIMLQGHDLIDTGHNLGDFELESIKMKDKSTEVKDAELYLLKSGFYQVMKDNLIKLRARGIGSTKNLLQEKFTVNRRIGMKQSIKKNFERMNIIEEQSIDNNIDGDSKRVWSSNITIEDIEAGAMIDSMPRNLDTDLALREAKALEEKKQPKLRASNYKSVLQHMPSEIATGVI